MENDENLSAEQHLAIDTTARSALADRLSPPRWYYPTFGVLVACLMASTIIDSTYAAGTAFVLFLLFHGGLGSLYRSKTGVDRGNPPGRALAINIVAIGGFLAVVLGSAALVGDTPGTLIGAALAFLLLAFGGPLVDTIVRDDLRRTR